jgi:hypothetical protein
MGVTVNESWRHNVPFGVNFRPSLVPDAPHVYDPISDHFDIRPKAGQA